MNNIDHFKYLVSAYFGVRLIDEYELKVYVLKDIEEYIKEYVKKEHLNNLDKIVLEIEKDSNNRTKLQDALLVLNEIGNYHELTLLIKKHLRKLEK